MSFRSPHSLMVQGTTSDAGKSVLVTALCRILARHQYTIAPFKPQNMALNSAVTIDGGEIGRAQAAQAQACYLQPTVNMNPILLKPNSDLGAQVIVNGQAIGNMTAETYHRYKLELLPTAVEAHNELRDSFEIVMIEGAGSPAEINLREHDIANMGFAEAIDCPVIIVADIDRGGVFAHLYGTYALLSETEKKRVKGFVINRFRGDIKLLESGLDWLEEKTTVPVLAVIPYIQNLHIEAEDSLSYGQKQPEAAQGQIIKIVVPVYPRASNHTDFDVLRLHPQVDCEFVKQVDQFKGADLIILPGSKNVRGDLKWLQDTGWDAVIKRHIRFGGKVIGICGGYQMLGRWIHDPEAVESEAGSSAGLGLLNLETTLNRNKTLRNVKGEMIDIGIAVSGYEIHVGETQWMEETTAVFRLHSTDNNADNVDEQNDDGYLNEDNNILVTYLHGIFDSAELLDYWLSWAGLSEPKTFDYDAFRDEQMDRLADVVEQALPLSALLSLLSMTAKT